MSQIFHYRKNRHIENDVTGAAGKPEKTDKYFRFHIVVRHVIKPTQMPLKVAQNICTLSPYVEMCSIWNASQIQDVLDSGSAAHQSRDNVAAKNVTF